MNKKRRSDRSSHRPHRRSNWLRLFPLVLVTTIGLVLANNGLMQPRSQADAIRGISATASSLTQASYRTSPVFLAQAPTSAQGNQLILNGRTFPIAWSVRQDRVGISDSGLMQAMGLMLLNSNEASRQPVQWFSDPATDPLVLPTWLSNQARFLDTSQLSQRFGWQVQPSGSVLRVTTPAARVLGVRQGKQSWGDRLVIDLDRPTPWQITEAGGEWQVVVAGSIDPAIAQNFIATSGNRVTSIKIEPSGAQTILRIGIPTTSIRPRTFTLLNPNRLVIDIRPDYMPVQDIQWALGLRWRQQYVNLGTAQFPITLLEIDPRQPGISVKPFWSNPGNAIGTAPLITTAQRSQAAAAINAGFFNRETQMPLGAIRQDNRWLSSPILNRGAIAWNNAGNFTVSNLSIQELITTSTGQRFPVRFFNSGYVIEGLSRYTREWGPTYTPVTNNEVIITVQGDALSGGAGERVVGQQPGGAAGQTAFAIPTNGYLLTARADQSAASAFPVGATLQHQFASNPAEFSRYPNIVGAGPLLIQNQRIVLNPEAEQFSSAFIGQRAVRSAIATTAVGNLILVAIQSRLDGPGPSLRETAQIMAQLGAVNALNLDGGSSASLYLGGQLLNRAPRTAARVHNGIGVFLQPNP